jgi:hypothetical protein
MNIYTSEDNWYKWRYSNGPLFGRRERNFNSLFETEYTKYYGQVGTFKEELQKAARSTLDHFPGLRPSILFSGGMDSEVLLRSFIDIGANPAVYVFRYEDNINYEDVLMAETVCRNLKINYNIIDFKLQKFLENEVEKISEEAEIDYPTALTHMKFFELVDGLPILGGGDQRWIRNNTDYTTRGIWSGVCDEFEIGWSKYIRLHNLQAVAEWYKWSPGLIISYLRLKWFNDLIDDKIYGKLSVKSTKYIGYQTVYPDIIVRKKLTGFETIQDLVIEIEATLKDKYSTLPYRNTYNRTINQVCEELIGEQNDS